MVSRKNNLNHNGRQCPYFLNNAKPNSAHEATNFNIKRDDLRHEGKITDEHVKNNLDVRKVLTNRGIKPEELPPAEDIKKLERRVKAEEKLLVKPPSVKRK
jgi:DNA-damage-inducible protein D